MMMDSTSLETFDGVTVDMMGLGDIDVRWQCFSEPTRLNRKKQSQTFRKPTRDKSAVLALMILGHFRVTCV